MYACLKQLMQRSIHLSFLRELKQRSVFKVGIAYLLAAWFILQLTDVFVSNLRLPEWAFQLILLLLALGLPVIMLLTWIYDLTPGGLLKTDARTQDAAIKDVALSKLEDFAPTALTFSNASVAVLPFVNLSGDPNNEYFSDGLSEELINVLSKINSLKVAARTSSFHFKGQTGNIANIGQTLGVASVLEGSVRQSGSRVRIAVQLVNTVDGYHLWSETYDRELDDIFSVQADIASSVSDALRVKLLKNSNTEIDIGGTKNAEAFQYYLLGIHQRNRGQSSEAIQSAANAFQCAIDLDRNYAKAYVGLAFSLSQLVENGFVNPAQGLGEVDEAVESALKLAPDLAESWMALGNRLTSYKANKVSALKAIAKAIDLNPGSAEVWIEYARIKCNLGDRQSSIAGAMKALELDPISVYANHFLGHVLYYACQYDEAVRVFRHVLELDPHFPKPHYFIAMILYWQGDFEAALKEVQLEPLGWMRDTASTVILHRLGRVKEADDIFAAFVAAFAEAGIGNFVQQAQVHAQLGNADQTITCLNLALDLGDTGLSQMMIEPLLDPVRDHPKFKKLAADFGFDAA